MPAPRATHPGRSTGTGTGTGALKLTGQDITRRTLRLPSAVIGLIVWFTVHIHTDLARHQDREDQNHASGGNSGSGMEENPRACPLPGSPSSPVSRADRAVRVKPPNPCGLTRPRPACFPGCRTTATGWTRPAITLGAARPRPGKQHT